MAELLPLAEIEARLMLLPPISRGTHLRGPTIYAARLVRLWGADDDVPLSDAFRLLDAATVAGVLLSGAVGRVDPRHWIFPNLTELLPPLREAAWQELVAGKLVVEGIKGDRGKQHRMLNTSELPRLTPDWQLSRLIRDDRDAYIRVLVRRLPPVGPVKPRLKQPEIKVALLAILEAEPTLSGEPLEHALCEKGTTRAKARRAIKQWASQTIKPRGRPRENNRRK